MLETLMLPYVIRSLESIISHKGNGIDLRIAVVRNKHSGDELSAFDEWLMKMRESGIVDITVEYSENLLGEGLCTAMQLVSPRACDDIVTLNVDRPRFGCATWARMGPSSCPSVVAKV